MRTTRLYVGTDRPLHVGVEIQPTDEQTHYLLRVLRLRNEDPVNLFDGIGGEWLAIISTTGKRSCCLQLQQAFPDVPAPTSLGLGLALLKGEALDRALQKAVELGAQHLILLATEHGNVHWVDDREQRRLKHVQRIVIAACEQSGTRFLPSLVGPLSLGELINDPLDPPVSFIALHPESPRLPLTLPRRPTTLLIGPEGGWSERELSWFGSSGIACHGLGKQVLRAETTPLAALSAVRHGWGWDP